MKRSIDFHVERCLDVRVLVVTTFDLDEYVLGALRAGAAGSCARTSNPPICSPGHEP